MKSSGLVDLGPVVEVHAERLVVTTRRGRPPLQPGRRKVPVGYRLPAWLVAWLRAQDRPATALIEEALIARHGLVPPSEPAPLT